MEEKVKLRYHIIRIIAEISAIAVLFFMFFNLSIHWNELPQSVPCQYDFFGKIIRYGHRNELISLPIISAVLYMLLTLIVFIRSLWNLPAAVPPQNNAKIITSIKEMMSLIKLEMIIIFAYLSNRSIKLLPLSRYFWLVSILLVLVTITVYILRYRRLKRA